MDVEPSFAAVGALLGGPARANILNALRNGRARTATASGHLVKLTEAGARALDRLLPGASLR